ncbi:MAG: hypothetical protein OEY89_03985 [Gammaproteobacteria bacterium]|nr:hypothetical protein [Gammaproteobacteria bacterium]
MKLYNKKVNKIQKNNLFLYAYTGCISFFFILSLLSSAIVYAEEIRFFKMLDYDGALSLRYLVDDHEIYSQGILIQKSERPVWQEELTINTDSYVYHPNFLKINLGAGVIYDQTEYDSLVQSYDSSESLINFSAKLDFLSKRPYPVSFYYNKETPTVSTGLTGGYLQENVKYGADISLLSPFFPVQTRLSAFRQSTLGQGAEQIVDDVIEQVKLDLSHSYGGANTFQLSHQNNNRSSRSGSAYLPIEERETSVATTNINTKNIFGSEREFQLVNNIGYREQVNFPERKEWSFVPNMRWKHNENIKSFYRLEVNNTKEQDIEVENNKIRTGVSYSDNSLSSSFDVYLHSNESTGFEFEDSGGKFNISDKIKADYGEYKFSYNASINYRDQTSVVSLLPVYGDEYVLSGIAQENIAREYIDITTIIVSNSGRTQVFIEDLDYRITVIGSQVFIQRLAGGNIVDGQTVLIDYSYKTGGTIKYDQLSQGIYINLAVEKYYDIYMKYYQTEQDLKEGIPTIRLNSSDGIVLGLRVDRPLAKQVNVGGELALEVHDEDINPYDKNNMDMFVNLPLPAMTNLRLNGRWLTIDNKNSDEDVDLKSLIVRIQSRPWLRVKMGFESSFEKDTGGAIVRRLRNNRMQFDWRYRQLNFRADIRHQLEEQGIIERNRWSVNMLIQRRF